MVIYYLKLVMIIKAVTKAVMNPMTIQLFHHYLAKKEMYAKYSGNESDGEHMSTEML